LFSFDSPQTKRYSLGSNKYRKLYKEYYLISSMVKEITSNRPLLKKIATGLALAVIGLAGSSHYLLNKSDPLYLNVAEYQVKDWLEMDGSLDDSYEDKLGVKILGAGNKEDLEALVKLCKDNLWKGESLSDLGIEEVIIFSEEEREKIGYVGRADKDGKLRLFTDKITPNIVAHELGHHKIFQMLKADPSQKSRWEQLAGPYDKVKAIDIKGTETASKYVDGSTGVSKGYSEPYGGLNWNEDMATHIAAVNTNPELYLQVHGDYDIYRKKLNFLLKKELIPINNCRKALAYIIFAEERMKSERAEKILYIATTPKGYEIVTDNFQLHMHQIKSLYDDGLITLVECETARDYLNKAMIKNGIKL